MRNSRSNNKTKTEKCLKLSNFFLFACLRFTAKTHFLHSNQILNQLKNQKLKNFNLKFKLKNLNLEKVNLKILKLKI